MTTNVLTPETKQTEPEPREPSEPRQPDRRSRVVAELWRTVLSLAIIGGSIAAVARYGGSKPAARKVPKNAGPTLVETVEVIEHEGELNVEVDGVTVPFREIQLAAEVAGRVDIKSDVCRAGNFVRKGTLLVQIDSATYQLEVNRLKQLQEEAKQNLAELNVEIANTDAVIALAIEDLNLWRNEVARQRRLSSSGVGTTTDAENALRAELQSQNSLTGLRNQQKLLTARRARLETSKKLAAIQLEQAQLDLSRTEIVAPVDGVIVSEMVEAGSYVQRGTTLLTFEDTRQVEVQCKLTMDELYRIWQSTAVADGEYDLPDTPVRVTYELAERVFQWDGVLSRYDGLGLDERTRTVPCRVVVSEPRNVRENDDSLTEAKMGPPALVRGMFVQVQIRTTPASSIVRIPETAVRPGRKVWLARDGELSIHTVAIAGVSGDDLLVDAEASGIHAGDRAVISPLADPEAGMSVQESAR